MKIAVLVHFLQFAFDGIDALANHAAVDFQLAFAFAEAASHAAAHTVACQVRPHAAQAGQQVMVLRKADLQTSFFRGGMQCEDVQDQRGSVDNLDGLRHDLLDVGLL